MSDASKPISPKPASDAGSEPIQSDSAALQELALSEARYRALVEGSSDFIYVLDPDGCFIFANNEIGHLLGYSPEEIIGRHYAEILHPEDVERAGRAFHERRTGDRVARRLEVRLRSRGGVTRDVEMDVRHFSFRAHGYIVEPISSVPMVSPVISPSANIRRANVS